MKIINLNKHAIMIAFVGPDHKEKTVIEPSGMVATVAVKQSVVKEVNGVPCVQNQYGEVLGLPEPQEDTLYLVNAIVLERAKFMGRSDCIAPDTGPTAIRDDKGQVTAVTRFVM
jgi:hypothetical protein